MKISVSLPYASSDTAEHVAVLQAVSRSTERHGLHAVAATDHPFPFVEPGRPGHQALDPFVLLGWVAQATERIALHFNLVVMPYRNPFLTARLLSTLDVLSAGRVIAALGSGYMRREFDALGADYARRGAQLEEGAAAMRQAWTGEPVTLAGERYRAEGNVMQPTPVARPHLPLWRGGNTKMAITSAVEHFDGWAPFEATEATSDGTRTDAVSLESLHGQIAVLRSEMERLERTAPIDICLVRPAARWLTDPARAADDLQELDAAGVTWVTTHVQGGDADQAEESIAALAEIARSAGVLDSTSAATEAGAGR